VQRVRGKVLTIMCPRTRKVQIVNLRHVRLVNPDIAWDEVAPRPKRQQGKGMRAPQMQREPDQPGPREPPIPPEARRGEDQQQRRVPPPGPPAAASGSDSSDPDSDPREGPSTGPPPAVRGRPAGGQKRPRGLEESDGTPPRQNRRVTRSGRSYGVQTEMEADGPQSDAPARQEEATARSPARQTATAPTPPPPRTIGAGGAVPKSLPHGRYALRARPARQSYYQSTTDDTDVEGGPDHRRLPHTPYGQGQGRSQRARQRRRRQAAAREIPPPPAAAAPPPPRPQSPPPRTQSPVDPPTPSGVKRDLTTTDDDHDDRRLCLEGAEKRGPETEDSLEEEEHTLKLFKSEIAQLAAQWIALTSPQ